MSMADKRKTEIRQDEDGQEDEVQGYMPTAVEIPDPLFLQKGLGGLVVIGPVGQIKRPDFNFQSPMP